MKNNFQRHYRIPEKYFENLEEKINIPGAKKRNRKFVFYLSAAAVLLLLLLLVPQGKKITGNDISLTDSIPAKKTEQAVTTKETSSNEEEDLVLDYLSMEGDIWALEDNL